MPEMIFGSCDFTSLYVKKIWLSISFLSFNKDYPCGEISTNKLKIKINNRFIVCKSLNKDRYNRLIADSADLLKYIDINTDEAIIQMRLSVTTWCDYDQPKKLRGQLAELIKAVQSWGFCEISEYSGDSLLELKKIITLKINFIIKEY